MYQEIIHCKRELMQARERQPKNYTFSPFIPKNLTNWRKERKFQLSFYYCVSHRAVNHIVTGMIPVLHSRVSPKTVWKHDDSVQNIILPKSNAHAYYSRYS